MKVQEVRYQIKKLAKEFDLKYNTGWFKHLWITAKSHILTEYIGDCPDPIYQKYGKNPQQRIKNIGKFISSKDFKVCLRRYGGQVVQRDELKQQKIWINGIKDEKLKEELIKLNNKLKEQFNKSDYLALLTIPRNEKEKKWQTIVCLRHEWIHILLNKNKIRFQTIAKKYWIYDEGINEYMGSYLDKTLGKLEKFRDRESYPIEKKYWIYAIKLRELLKGKNIPKKRKEAIFSLLSNLKSKNL